jgi:hypothetical protein
MLNCHRLFYGLRPLSNVTHGLRCVSLEAGEGKSGHIHTDSDEGIVFFGSRSIQNSGFTSQVNTIRCVSLTTPMATSTPVAN